MKQSSRIISTYSADTMGVCSALFELGGMTIMHDASGCNSTYTTHDEPRWYDMDSMVYISALTEMEAIMGDDEKLLTDIEDAAAELHPKFIAIAGTPIPTMTGFDFGSVARLAETRTGIPCMGFSTTGMNTYVHGASMAFAELARRLEDFSISADKATRHGADSAVKVNVIGLTPLDFSVNGTDDSICEWLEANGFGVVSKWAMGSSLAEICLSPEADVDLVVSAAGLGAAEVMRERFGIPYVVGLPVGEGLGKRLSRALLDMGMESRKAHKNGERIVAQQKLSITGAETSTDNEDAAIFVIGEGVTSLALASAIELETGKSAVVLCTTECPTGILRPIDRMTPDEEDIITELKCAKTVIADPLYQPICPTEAEFIRLPSEAFSGRLYRDEIPNTVANPQAVLGKLK